MRSLRLILQSCIMAFPLAASQLESSPIRVRIPDFTITLSPAAPDLTTIEAKEVRDIAESLFESYLKNFNWSASTFYDYAGLSGVEEVVLDESTNPSVTVIKVRGGLVVFTSESQTVPSELDIEGMLGRALYPTSPSEASLTDFLKITTDFSFVETSAYNAVLPPSALPSQSPIYVTVSPSHLPSGHPSSSPSQSPSHSSQAPTHSSMSPSQNPSMQASALPTIAPSPLPSRVASQLPTDYPVSPTNSPSMQASSPPSFPPSYSPSRASQAPTDSSRSPTHSPSLRATWLPSRASPTPTYSSVSPTYRPSIQDTSPPTFSPSHSPSGQTQAPTFPPVSQSRNPSEDTSANVSAPPSSIPLTDGLPSVSDDVQSDVPSHEPSFKTDVSKLAGGNAPTTDSSNSSSSNGKVVGGAVAGVAALVVIAGLFIHNRRGRQEKEVTWKAGALHSFPVDESDEAGLHKRDSLQDPGASDSKSETGSSVLGRLLVAAALPTRSMLNDSPETTPQGSSTSEGSMDDFGATTIIPSILKLNSLESFEVDRHMNVTSHSVQKDMMESRDQSIPLEWQSTPHIAMPYRSALSSVGVASTLHFDKWSDCSSGQGETDTDNDNKTLEESDVEGNFMPDDAWDFQDNEEDGSDVMPFYTPTHPGFHSESQKTLLAKTAERSSSASPSINCFSAKKAKPDHAL